MNQSGKPKWQEQVEEILREKFNSEEREIVRTRALELLDMVDQVERPQGDSWDAVRAILHLAIEDLPPLSSAMAGFQLGVAYEKCQNARGT